MKQSFLTVAENVSLLPGVMRMRLTGDFAPVTAPGQFVNLKLAGKFLRRPISVCDWDPESLTLLYKIVGAGTKELAAARPGSVLDALTGLGNGFDLAPAGDRPLLIGGGIGAAPLYGLAKALTAAGKRPAAVLGFNTEGEIFCEEEFRALIPDLIYTTLDGSRGIRGFVTAAANAVPAYTYQYVCGPEPMLRAVFRGYAGSGQFSFEERMGCGFGACMGCSCETLAGPKRICRDGPVLRKEELLWTD